MLQGQRIHLRGGHDDERDGVALDRHGRLPMGILHSLVTRTERVQRGPLSTGFMSRKDGLGGRKVGEGMSVHCVKGIRPMFDRPGATVARLQVSDNAIYIYSIIRRSTARPLAMAPSGLYVHEGRLV